MPSPTPSDISAAVAEDLIVTPSVHGARLWFRGRLVDDFASVDAAWAASKVARQALPDLSNLLTKGAV